LLFVIVLFVVTCVLSAKKRKFAKKSAEQDAVLTALYEILPDMIACKDNDDRFTQCNDLFAKFIGTDESQVVGKALTDMLEVTKRMPAAEITAADRKALSEGMKIKTPSLPMLFPDGSRRYYESIRTPLILRKSKRSKKGGTIGILCVFRDLTDVKDKETVAAASSEFPPNSDGSQAKDEQITALNAELLKLRKAALCTNSLRYIAAMGAALSDEDYTEYANHMASVKIDTASVGAQSLSERAFLLEDAVARQDYDYIKTNHPEFISSLSTLLGQLDAEIKQS
jgi:PAS domain S-box-containing protein